MTSRSMVVRILASLFLVALGAWAVWYQGPLLVRDFGIGDKVEAATQARLIEGRCRARLILHWCDIKVDLTNTGVTRRSELKYLFVDLPMTDHQVRLLSAKADRSNVTTDLGQQMLWNRAITLAALLALCLSPVVLLPRAWARRLRAS